MKRKKEPLLPTGNCVLFVCNKAYLGRMLKTLLQVRTIGKYRGEVVVIVGDDLKDQVETLAAHPLRVIPHHFPDLDLAEMRRKISGRALSDGREHSKVFQWHKIYCFHPFIKRWEKVLYIDSGMQVFHSLEPFFSLETFGKLVAHSDSYPQYSNTLAGQFNMDLFPELGTLLGQNYRLDIDYFQSTMMLYNTGLVQENTFDSLLGLAKTYYNSRTNEQGIMNLFFLCQEKLWQPLPTESRKGVFLYDFFERGDHRPSEYILLKYPKGKLRTELRILQSFFSREPVCG